MQTATRRKLCVSAVVAVSLLQLAQGDFSYVEVANQDYLQHGDVSSMTFLQGLW